MPDDKSTKDKSRLSKGLTAAGNSLSQSGRDEMDRAADMRVTPVAYRRGGKVRKVSRRRAKRRR